MKLKNSTAYTGEKFNDLDFVNGKLQQSEFLDCLFVGCNLSESAFVKCRFSECTFKQCNLNLIKFDSSKLIETHFKNSKLTGINWTALDWSSFRLMAPMFFESCDLSFSLFNGLELQELGMQDCKAHDVDFSECDLRDSDFFRTDFLDARFALTRLDNCNFLEAVNYAIDPLNSFIKGARFSSPEVLSLLSCFEVKVDE